MAGQPEAGAATVASVHGELPVSALGVTLMHEHLFVLDPEIRQTYNGGWDEAARVSDAVGRLEAGRAAGVETVVDVTVIGLGRYIPRIQAVAERTAVNVLAATGLYTYSELPLYFRGGRPTLQTVDRLTDTFIGDLTAGIGDSGVRAAILKCASDYRGLTEGIQRLFRAVAQAQRQTGAPITTHTNELARPGCGLEQQEFLLTEGVDPSRLIIGHLDDSREVSYLERILENGSYLGLDHLNGILPSPTLEDRIALIAELCRRGHSRRLVLSHDTFCFAESYENLSPPGYTLIFDRVLPSLKEQGVTDEQIRTMLVDNPRRIFENTKPY
jgi:phosphotriesterase-related protein